MLREVEMDSEEEEDGSGVKAEPGGEYDESQADYALPSVFPPPSPSLQLPPAVPPPPALPDQPGPGRDSLASPQGPAAGTKRPHFDGDTKEESDEHLRRSAIEPTEANHRAYSGGEFPFKNLFSMKDIPTNLVVTREDKKDLCSVVDCELYGDGCSDDGNSRRLHSIMV